MKRCHDPLSLLLRCLVYFAAAFTFFTVVFLVGYILIKGLPHLTPDLFRWVYTHENVSLMPALVNTVLMTGLSLLIAAPLGIFSAIFLTEYSNRQSPIVVLIRMAAETLSGIPSIVYGLFGMLFFLVTLNWGYSLLAGTFTLAIMILPLIMRTTEEALLAVPLAYREGSFGLGAGRLRTVFSIVLPAASPGILAGIILAVGRVVSETAALMFTAGTKPAVPGSVMDSTRTLSVHMYILSGEGLFMDQSYATAVVLIVLVVAINALAHLAAKKMTGGSHG